MTNEQEKSRAELARERAIEWVRSNKTIAQYTEDNIENWGKSFSFGLAPHEDRVVHERDELVDRVQKLGAFMDGPVFQTLEQADRNLLIQQFSLMVQMRSVLGQRIERFFELKAAKGL